MEQLLTESEVVVFDVILNLLQNHQLIYSQQLPKLDSNYFSQNTDVQNNTYTYYLKRLETYDVLKVTSLGNDVSYHITKTPLTQEFYNQGGFRSLYEKQQRKLQERKYIEDLKKEKLYWDNKISKYQAKTKYLPLIISVISIVISIIALFHTTK